MGLAKHRQWVGHIDRLYSPVLYMTGNVPSNGDCWTGTSTYNEYGNWNRQRPDAARRHHRRDVSQRRKRKHHLYFYSTQMNNPELPVSLLVATEIGLYDGMGHAATTTYQYAGGKMYLASACATKNSRASQSLPRLPRIPLAEPFLAKASAPIMPWANNPTAMPRSIDRSAKTFSIFPAT